MTPWYKWRGIDARVLLAVPILSALLGLANNFRVVEDRRVDWSGTRLNISDAAEVSIDEDVDDAEEDGATDVDSAKRDVEPGIWTTDFVSATNAAHAAHVPVVVVAFSIGCPSCRRLHKAIQSEEVRAWQKKLGWYFVMTARSSSDAARFVETTPVRNNGYPHVGVYWRRPDGTHVMRNFTGRSNEMGVPSESSLSLEWMHAVEASVSGAPGVSYVPTQDMGVQIEVKVGSKGMGWGRVTMSPLVDVIHAGQKVILMATPRRGSEFEGWRYPDGQVVQGGAKLTLDHTCQAGVYLAIFRRRKGNGKGDTLKKAKEE